MEKFRDFAIEYYTKTQNKPLTEAQNSIIQNALHGLLPLLNQTPEHPPYAWMILKAIEELGENGDSLEKSISDCIKKQYKDLPWAHDTLLNHHLKNLCTSGDIVLTCNQTYVLSALHSNHKSKRKSSNKQHVRKKQDWDWCNTKQKRRVGKVYTKQKENKSHLIAEERPEGQKVSTEVHEIKIADSQDQHMQPITTITDIGLQQIQCGENRAILTQTELAEVCNQQTIPEPRSTTDEPLHCSGADKVRRIVYQYKKRPPGWKSKENQTKKQRLEEFETLEQVQKQLNEKPIFLSDPQYSKTIDSNKDEVECHELRDSVSSGTPLKHEPQKSEFCSRKYKLEFRDSVTKPSYTAEEEPLSDPAHILHLEKTSDKPKHQGRGRPRKINKPGYRGRDSVTKPSYTAEEEPLSDPAHILHLEKTSDKPKHQGRGRPLKINKPGYRGRGRPPKIR